jgi:hypothetical protein
MSTKIMSKAALKQRRNIGRSTTAFSEEFTPEGELESSKYAQTLGPKA